MTQPGGVRHAYDDAALAPEGGDWTKYAYTLRLFGRLLYNPDADPDVWQRALVLELAPDATATVYPGGYREYVTLTGREAPGLRSH